jgi:hypothetical protein
VEWELSLSEKAAQKTFLVASLFFFDRLLCLG